MNEPLDEIKAAIAKHKGNARAAAQELGISPATISRLLSGARGVGDKLAKKLGWVRKWVKI